MLQFYVPLEYSSSLSKALEIITRQAVIKDNGTIISTITINLLIQETYYYLLNQPLPLCCILR